jgi:hypothetical protein
MAENLGDIPERHPLREQDRGARVTQRLEGHTRRRRQGRTSCTTAAPSRMRRRHRVPSADLRRPGSSGSIGSRPTRRG